LILPGAFVGCAPGVKVCPLFSAYRIAAQKELGNFWDSFFARDRRRPKMAYLAWCQITICRIAKLFFRLLIIVSFAVLQERIVDSSPMKMIPA
jgi:hypothetical protein